MNVKEAGFVSCVVYVHNNERELDHFLEIVYTVFEQTFSRYEFLFVDDSSGDGSAEKIRDFFASRGGWRSYRYNHGILSWNGTVHGGGNGSGDWGFHLRV